MPIFEIYGHMVHSPHFGHKYGFFSWVGDEISFYEYALQFNFLSDKVKINKYVSSLQVPIFSPQEAHFDQK